MFRMPRIAGRFEPEWTCGFDSVPPRRLFPVTGISKASNFGWSGIFVGGLDPEVKAAMDAAFSSSKVSARNRGQSRCDTE